MKPSERIKEIEHGIGAVIDPVDRTLTAVIRYLDEEWMEFEQKRQIILARLGHMSELCDDALSEEPHAEEESR